MNANAPIGIFDSGVGGTSIWREIHELMPNEDTVYLADSKNSPYGNKSKKDIQDLCVKNTECLISMGCKAIVVACNTATTNAISTLRKTYDFPFIGIEPAIKPAALGSKNKKVGVLATQGTLASDLFHKTADTYADGVEIIEVVGEGLVRLIEEGHIDDPEMDELLIRYLTPMINAQVDHIVLGCSHYPYLIPKIEKIIESDVRIVDSGEAVARQTRNVLIKNNLINLKETKGASRFFTNGSKEVLERILSVKGFPEPMTLKVMNF